jgi:signal transduction histidine kinase
VIALIAIWNAMAGHGPLPRASMTEDVLFIHFFLLVFTVPLVLLMGYRVEQRRALASISDTRNRLITWEEHERERVGRELHDDIVQRLALIAVEVDRLGSGGGLANVMDVQPLYREVTKVSEATRQLSHEVHPFVLEYAGLGPALRSLCHRVAQQSGVHISFTQHETKGIGKDASLCLYRVAQEALQNVVRHSQARMATVHLAVSEGRAVLRIVDDGIGIGSEEYLQHGMGLANMRERVTALNGVFDIISASTKGTIVTATLPVHSESHAST